MAGRNCHQHWWVGVTRQASEPALSLGTDGWGAGAQSGWQVCCAPVLRHVCLDPQIVALPNLPSFVFSFGPTQLPAVLVPQGREAGTSLGLVPECFLLPSPN